MCNVPWPERFALILECHQRLSVYIRFGALTATASATREQVACVDRHGARDLSVHAGGVVHWYSTARCIHPWYIRFGPCRWPTALAFTFAFPNLCHGCTHLYRSNIMLQFVVFLFGATTDPILISSSVTDADDHVTIFPSVIMLT